MVKPAVNMNSSFLDFEIFPLDEEINNFCSGSNKRNLLIAIKGETSPSSLDLLRKIMKSVGYDAEEDAMIFALKEAIPFSFKSLERRHHFKHAIFFGIEPAEAGLQLSVQPYVTVQIAGIQYLFCHELNRLQTDASLKRPLWEALKSMFIK